MLALLALATALAQASQSPVPSVNPTLDAARQHYRFVSRPLIREPASLWQSFFKTTADWGIRGEMENSRRAFRLNDEEYQALVTITLDLAQRSRAYKDLAAPYEFEARMQGIEANKVSAQLQQKLNELDAEWSRVVMDHQEQLRKSLREPVFRAVNEFAQSNKRTP